MRTRRVKSHADPNDEWIWGPGAVHVGGDYVHKSIDGSEYRTSSAWSSPEDLLGQHPDTTYEVYDHLHDHDPLEDKGL